MLRASSLSRMGIPGPSWSTLSYWAGHSLELSMIYISGIHYQLVSWHMRWTYLLLCLYAKAWFLSLFYSKIMGFSISSYVAVSVTETIMVGQLTCTLRYVHNNHLILLSLNSDLMLSTSYRKSWCLSLDKHTLCIRYADRLIVWYSLLIMNWKLKEMKLPTLPSQSEKSWVSTQECLAPNTSFLGKK